jgi:hypothetical protein
MTRISRILILTIAMTGFLVAPRVVTGPARGDSGCSAASIHGPYGVEGSGFIFGAPAAFVGTWSFDGAGQSTGSFLLNLGGNLDRIDMKGTYQVSSACAGVLSIFTPHHKPPVEHYHDLSFVVVDGGNEVFFVASGPKRTPSDEPPPGETVSGRMKRL